MEPRGLWAFNAAAKSEPVSGELEPVFWFHIAREPAPACKNRFNPAPGLSWARTRTAFTPGAGGGVILTFINRKTNEDRCGCQIDSAARSTRGPALTDDITTLDVSTQANGQIRKGCL